MSPPLKARIAEPRLWGVHPKNCVSNLSSCKRLYVFQVVQTSCGAHADSYSVD